MQGYCSTGQSPQWAVLPMEDDDICYHMGKFMYSIILTSQAG